MPSRRQLLMSSALVSSVLPWSAARAQWPSEEGEYRIQRAFYGTAERHVDVTDKLREIARSDQRVRLTNELFGVDPARGEVKQLRIVARGQGGRQRIFEYTEGSFIDGSLFSGWGRGDWGRGDWGRGDGGSWGGRPGYEDGRGGEYRILTARYGTLQRNIDVTQRLRELVSGNRRFQLGNELFGTDPARGERKTLRISARRGDGPVRVFEYAEGSVVDGAQFSEQGGGALLQILSAEYGAGRRRSDVREQLQQRVVGGRLQLRVDNDSLGGDPAPGQVKRLRVRYRAGGRERSREFNEGEFLSLP